MMRLAAALVVSLSILGCSRGVRPLDPRDPSLPTQTRQWLASAQDGVIAARARRDAARRELDMVREWANRLDEEVDLGRGPSQQLDELADARVELAETELDIAERQVTFAEAKLDLAYAERAVHHDLGSYDLEPIREQVANTRGRVEEATRRLVEQRTRVIEANRSWWASYAQFAQGGGDTRSFWIGEREPIENVEESAPREHVPADEELSAAANEGEEADEDASEDEADEDEDEDED